jgi:hypothetical protein
MRKITALLAVVAVIGCKEVSLMSGTGRYQIVGSRSDTFFIDTQRGRVWVLNPGFTVGEYDYPRHFSRIDIIDGEKQLGVDWKQWMSTPKLAELLMKMDEALKESEEKSSTTKEQP